MSPTPGHGGHVLREERVIQVTRLNDTEIIVNADLIEVIEATPDTIITLIDGTRFVAREKPLELVDRIQRYRAGILSLRDDPIIDDDRPERAPMTIVPDSGDDQ
jgi:flagellar protein FlbD